MFEGELSGTNQTSQPETLTPERRRRSRGKPGTGYRYVSHYQGGRYRAAIMVNGKYVHLGIFDNPISAAKRADEWSRKLHGKNAHLNFPSEQEQQQLNLPVPPRRRRRRMTAELRNESALTHRADVHAKTTQTFGLECIDGLQQLVRVKRLLESLTPQQHELLANLSA